MMTLSLLTRITDSGIVIIRNNVKIIFMKSMVLRSLDTRESFLLQGIAEKALTKDIILIHICLEEEGSS